MGGVQGLREVGPDGRGTGTERGGARWEGCRSLKRWGKFHRGSALNHAYSSDLGCNPIPTSGTYMCIVHSENCPMRSPFGPEKLRLTLWLGGHFTERKELFWLQAGCYKWLHQRRKALWHSLWAKGACCHIQVAIIQQPQ